MAKTSYSLVYAVIGMGNGNRDSVWGNAILSGDFLVFIVRINVLNLIRNKVKMLKNFKT